MTKKETILVSNSSSSLKIKKCPKYPTKDARDIVASRRRGVVVTSTPKRQSVKPQLRLCAQSNPARGVSEIAMVKISYNGPD